MMSKLITISIYKLIVKNSKLNNFSKIMLQLGNLQIEWYQMPLKKKIGMFKRIMIECCVIGIISIIFFWSTLLTMWFFTIMIGPDSYFQEAVPNYRVHSIKRNSLACAFINNEKKQQICQNSIINANLFNQLTITHNQFCNIQHRILPQFTRPTDITIRNVDCMAVKYVTGCIKYANKQYTCQKYYPNIEVKLFQQLNLMETEYFILQLQLKEEGLVPYGSSIEFYEHCSWIIRYFKDYYHVITLFYTYGVTSLLTICIILVRFIYVIRQLTNKAKQKQEQKIDKQQKEADKQMLRMQEKNKNKVQ